MLGDLLHGVLALGLTLLLGLWVGVSLSLKLSSGPVALLGGRALGRRGLGGSATTSCGSRDARARASGCRSTISPRELEVDVLGRWVDSDSGLEQVVGNGSDSVGGSLVGQLRKGVG